MAQQENFDDVLLQVKCSSKHLSEIAQFISWREVGCQLPEITKHDIEDIDKEGRDKVDKGEKLLKLWEKRNEDFVTYCALMRAMTKAGKKDEATNVCRLVNFVYG